MLKVVKMDGWYTLDMEISGRGYAQSTFSGNNYFGRNDWKGGNVTDVLVELVRGVVC